MPTLGGWYKDKGLNINPHKNNVCIYTNKKKITINLPMINGIQLIHSKKVKHLEVILMAYGSWAGNWRKDIPTNGTRI